MERCAATRGVNQAGDHAEGSGVRQLSGRARLRPECSRRPGTVECADVAVAQSVVDQCEQFACRGDLGDVAAAASFDALFVGRDLSRRRVALYRLDGRPADRFGALLGDVSAMHDGVGLAVARGQPGPMSTGGRGR